MFISPPLQRRVHIDIPFTDDFAVFAVCSCSQSCHIALGLPTCALWMPDPDAIMKLFTHEIPAFLGGLGLIAIVSASMSSKSIGIHRSPALLTQNY